MLICHVLRNEKVICSVLELRRGMSGPSHCLSSPGAGDCSAKENLERGTSEPQVKSPETVNKQTNSMY